MALAVEDNPPELFMPGADPDALDTVTNAKALSGAGSENAATGAKESGVEPFGFSKIFGPCPWAVAQVGYQKEKAVARTLMGLEIPYFLPMQAVRYRGSRNIVHRILFEGLVFFRADPKPPATDYFRSPTSTEAEVRRLNHVFGLIRTGDQAHLKREMSIFVPTENGERIFSRISPEDAVPGKRVEIIDGPFRGLQGFIDPEINYAKDRNKIILYVSLRWMGTDVRGEVPIDWLMAL